MLKKIRTQLSYSFSANVLSMLLGALSVLIIPKFIGVTQFGYYQLYLFYMGYIIISSFGLSDGNYLSIGGLDFEQLDYEEQNAQFVFITITQVFLYLFIIGFISIFAQADEKIVYILVCVSAIISQLRYYLYLSLQATSQIKKYAVIIITERFISVVFSIIAIISGYRGYMLLIELDIIGRLISLIIAIYFCRIYVIRVPASFIKYKYTIINNIKSGFMVLFSTLSSSFIIGISRFAIQQYWGIEQFSKVSLTISISNMATRCINSVGIVMFPILRRENFEKLQSSYQKMNILLMNSIFLIFIFYQPGAKLLSIWLPKYTESLIYASILLPICAYECKNIAIVSTYLKTLKKERIMMLSNIIAIFTALIGTILGVLIFNEIEIVMLSIVISLIVKTVYSELVIYKILNLYDYREIIFEIILCVSFIICNRLLSFSGMIIYLFIVTLYTIHNKNVFYSFFKR